MTRRLLRAWCGSVAPVRGTLRSGRWSVVALFGLLAACGGADTEVEPEAQSSPSADVEAAAQEGQPVDLRDVGVSIGDTVDVAVGVVEFSDFGCIHCATFHIETFHALEDEFIETGDVFWKYIPITLGGFPNGDLAAAAGICANRGGVFAEVRDRLFTSRERWMGLEEDEAAELFVSFAEAAGTDPGEFEQCLESDEVAEEIERNNQVALDVGVQVTPTFLIGGQGVQGALPLERFQTVLRDMIQQVRAAQDSIAAEGAQDAPAAPAEEDPAAP